MTISATDIKLKKPQRLTDNPDGGGRMTPIEIVDNQLNNLFPDVSSADRITGRASMRKVFVHVETENTDTFYGARALISDPPDDDSVFVTMFPSGSYPEERAAARNRVEAYVSQAIESRWVMMGDHFAGQRTLAMYGMIGSPGWDLGDVIALSTEAAGFEETTQYVRVSDIITRGEQSFVDASGEFVRDVLTLETSTPLLSDFFGQEPVRNTALKPPTRIRLTSVTDAATYYSVRRLTEAAEPGDYTVKVLTPYVPLVPSTQAETPVVDVIAGMGSIAVVPAGAADALESIVSGSVTSAGKAIHLGGPVVRGTVSIDANSEQLVDDGTGGIRKADQTPTGYSGTVDYETGAIVLRHAGTSGTFTARGMPGGVFVAQNFSTEKRITINNRGYAHVFQFAPVPAPGTVYVDYRALGKWIRLSDNGRGQLLGNPGQGSGSVNYSTGSVSVTLGALPDNGSSILLAWGTPKRTLVGAGTITPGPIEWDQQLANAPVKADSVSISWLQGGIAKSATDNASGVLSGNATGTVDYATGRVRMNFTATPDDAASIVVDYEWSDSTQTEFPGLVPDGAGFVSFTIPNAPLRGRSVEVQFTHRRYWWNAIPLAPTLHTARDDGAGGFGAGEEGTINYTTGAVTLKVNRYRNDTMPVYGYVEHIVGAVSFTEQVLVGYTEGINFFSFGGTLSARAATSASGFAVESEPYAAPAVAIDLTPSSTSTILPGSVRFTFGGATYVDRVGSIYKDPNDATGIGALVGSIDYLSGRIRLTEYPAGLTGVVVVVAMTLTPVETGLQGYFFRAPGSPLKAGNLTIRANRLDTGALITGAADINGVITGASMLGEVDWESGIIRLIFGDKVTAAGNEAEPWYDADFIDGDGKILKPVTVLPSTVFFNTVLFKSIPLSPVILGLDPVRLPEDGRVLAFAPGRVAIVHHSAIISVASPIAGQVVNFGRDRIAEIRVVDALGVAVLSSWYEADLDLGTLTFEDPLNLSAYTLPILITHRIDDSSLISDVQITGEIELGGAITHSFPALESYVSSALFVGEVDGSQDLQARYGNKFQQETWTGVFSNDLIGDAPDSVYNDVLYPFVVTNAAAVTERWALRFVGATSFQIIGETLGIIGGGDTTTTTAPINPATITDTNPTGDPYWTILPAGWGIGWSVDNVVRFNTIGALGGIWLVRTTLAGPIEEPTDGFTLQVIGDNSLGGG